MSEDIEKTLDSLYLRQIMHQNALCILFANLGAAMGPGKTEELLKAFEAEAKHIIGIRHPLEDESPEGQKRRSDLMKKNQKLIAAFSDRVRQARVKPSPRKG
ncbi:hypothetical protein [Hyphomicrobium sp. DY-1]|uniref:hypothetical protein n=1 Tax=Hyphomicrobium sp. DY-1 TaxID=3075650 RepID=UPI0039C4A8DB